MEKKRIGVSQNQYWNQFGGKGVIETLLKAHFILKQKYTWLQHGREMCCVCD